MLTTFILNSIIDVIAGPLSLLPTESSLNINSLTGTLTSSAFFPNLGWANNYFPLDEFGTLLTIALTTWLITYLIKFALWIWNTIKP
jgi:hypothetical protein